MPPYLDQVQPLGIVDGDGLFHQALDRCEPSPLGQEYRRCAGVVAQHESALRSLQNQGLLVHGVGEDGVAETVSRRSRHQKLKIASVAGATGDAELGAAAISRW